MAPLAVPAEPAIAAVAESAAVRLFVQQASMVRPGFVVTDENASDIAAICRKLDGLPLAIELAASRARLLSPQALLARLGRSMALAAADAGRPSRQQTLRAARTAGAAAAVRQMAGMPIAPHDAEMLEGFLAPARATVSLAEWDAEYGAGRGLSQEQAATLLLALNQ